MEDFVRPGSTGLLVFLPRISLSLPFRLLPPQFCVLVGLLQIVFPCLLVAWSELTELLQVNQIGVCTALIVSFATKMKTHHRRAQCRRELEELFRRGPSQDHLNFHIQRPKYEACTDFRTSPLPNKPGVNSLLRISNPSAHRSRTGF